MSNERHTLEHLPVPAFMILPEKHRTRMQRVVDTANRYVLSAVLLLMIAAALYMACLAFWPVRTFDVNQQPLPLEKTTLQQGETIPYILDYCKHIDTSAKVIAALRYPDGSSYTYPLAENKAQTGCRVAKPTSRAVPANAPEVCGVVLHLSYRYRINAIQGERGPDLQTEPFCITAAQGVQGT